MSEPVPVACPLCGKPALKTTMSLAEGTVDVIGCNCVPKESEAIAVDQRLTGFRIQCPVDLDSPESQARIRRMVDAFRERYPNPAGALHRAQRDAVEVMRLREDGFSEADRADLFDWIERIAPPSRD